MPKYVMRVLTQFVPEQQGLAGAYYFTQPFCWPEHSLPRSIINVSLVSHKKSKN